MHIDYSIYSDIARRKKSKKNILLKLCPVMVLLMIVLGCIIVGTEYEEMKFMKVAKNIEEKEIEIIEETSDIEEIIMSEDLPEYNTELVEPTVVENTNVVLASNNPNRGGYNRNTIPGNATYTQEDYDYLVMVLTGECQNQDYDFQMKVGSVVINRVNHEKFKNTVKDVCLSPGQYACFWDGNAYRTPTETSKQVAHDLLTNGSVLPSNVVWQANFPQGEGVYEYLERGNTYLCYSNYR